VRETMVGIAEVRQLTKGLPRSYEATVGGRVKFRIGRIVYLAFSRDESLLGFAFPKEERAGLIAGAPDTFMMPRPSEQRYNWVVVRLAAIDDIELRELVLDAWRLVVPTRIATEHLG